MWDFLRKPSQEAKSTCFGSQVRKLSPLVGFPRCRFTTIDFKLSLPQSQRCGFSSLKISHFVSLRIDNLLVRTRNYKRSQAVHGDSFSFLVRCLPDGLKQLQSFRSKPKRDWYLRASEAFATRISQVKMFAVLTSCSYGRNVLTGALFRICSRDLQDTLWFVGDNKL